MREFAHFLYFFFQAEDGIRDIGVTGFRRVLFRSGVGCVAEVRAKGASASVQQGADDGKVAAQGPSVAWRRPRMVPLEVLVPYMPRAPDARKPPSTGIAMPVTYRASSDTK